MSEQDPGSAARHASLQKHFLAILQEQGRVLNPPETAILNKFIDSEHHFTLQELCAEARRLDPAVTEEMTGEMLQMLCEYKIAHEVLMRGQALYEHYHLSSHHDHFVCVKCGGVENFYDSQIENLQSKNARAANFRPLIHRLEIYGVCASCVEGEEKVFPLRDCLAGETVRVVRLVGSSQMRQRMSGMGILAGEILRVLGLNANLETVMVAVKSTRLALSAEIARRILVTAVDVASADVDTASEATTNAAVISAANSDESANERPPFLPQEKQEAKDEELCHAGFPRDAGTLRNAGSLRQDGRRESFWFRWRWRSREEKSENTND